MMAREPYSGMASTFNQAAPLYHRVRPGYPVELFHDLAGETGLADGARVLEIGAGTGQATRGLLEQGWSVVALEPGPDLAAMARQALTGVGEVDVVVSSFEQWERRGQRFELIVAATSWHWLDPRVAYRKAADTLRDDGYLAIIATDHVFPPDADELFRDVQKVYQQVGMSNGQAGPQPPDAIPVPDFAAIVGSGFFSPPIVHRYLWSWNYSADDYLALLSTYSNHIAARPEQRDTLFSRIQELIDARPSAVIRKHYLNTLQVARRID